MLTCNPPSHPRPRSPRRLQNLVLTNVQERQRVVNPATRATHSVGMRAEGDPVLGAVEAGTIGAASSLRFLEKHDARHGAR